MQTWENLANSDFTTFWLAGKSVVMGYDAYDTESWLYWRHYFGATWDFNPIFIYPLPLRILLTPIGLLPLPQSYILWLVISQVLILFCVFRLYTWLRKSDNTTILLFFGVGIYLFRPTILSLRYGQFSPWLMLILTGAILLWEKERWFWGGFVLAFLMVKPQLGVLFILIALLWLVFRKVYRGMSGLAAGGVFLVILGVVQNPNWVMVFLTTGNDKLQNTFAYGPNVWGVARLLTNGQAILLVGIMLTLAVVGFLNWYVRKYKASLSITTIMGLGTPVVLMTTPYIWGYDQIFLLFPLTLIAALWAQRVKSILWHSFVFIFAAVISFLLYFPTQVFNFDYFSFFLPLVILIVLAWLLKRQDWKYRETEQ